MDNKITTGTDNQHLADQLCHRFYVISNAITRAYRPLLEATNLTYPQYVVMMALWEEDNIRISALQEKTLIDIGCLSMMLKKMVEKGLIELHPSETDRRAKHVKLTKAGAALKTRAQKARDKLQQAQQSPLSPAEFQQLIKLLDRLKEGLLERSPPTAKLRA